MTSGLPPVKLIPVDGNGNIDALTADTVVGVDVSGSFGDDDYHVVTAVRVERTNAETLLEDLFAIDMLPWLGKWSEFNSAVEDPHERIRRLVERIDHGRFSWSALYFEGEQSSEQIAAAVGITAGQAIVRGGETERTTRGVLLYDGGPDMLGKKQRELRRQATESFNNSFVEAHHEMTIASLVEADEKYPEVATADLLGGHIRDSLAEGRELSDIVRRRTGKIGSAWSPPQVDPEYELFGLADPQFRSLSEIEARIVAWLRGRMPNSDVSWSPSRFEAIVEQEVTSGQVKSTVKRLPEISPVTH